MFIQLFFVMAPVLLLACAENITLDGWSDESSDCCFWTTNGFYYQPGGAVGPTANHTATNDPLGFWWLNGREQCGLRGARALINFQTANGLPIESIRVRFRMQGKSGRLYVHTTRDHVVASFTYNGDDVEWREAHLPLPSDVESVTVIAEAFTLWDLIKVDSVVAVINDLEFYPDLRERRSINDAVGPNSGLKNPKVKDERGDDQTSPRWNSSGQFNIIDPVAVVANDQTKRDNLTLPANGDGRTAAFPPGSIPIPGALPGAVMDENIEDIGSYVIIENDKMCNKADEDEPGTKIDYYPTNMSRGPCLWGCSRHEGAGATDSDGEPFTWCWPARGTLEKVPCSKGPYEDIYGNGCATPCTPSSSDGVGRCIRNQGGEGQCSVRVERYRSKSMESTGKKCVTRCAADLTVAGHYCFVGNENYGKCSPYTAVTYLNQPCRDECDKRDEEEYWCNTNDGRGFCSPIEPL